MKSKPLIAITMGDPCGIGPEIVAKAVSDPAVTAVCIPLIIGDRHAMERANRIVGTELKFGTMTVGAKLPQIAAREVLLYELSDLDENEIIYSKPGKQAGNAVYDYIKTAVELCTSNQVDAIATAPINKEALNCAGYRYPGHTELLAELTNTERVVMMLAGKRLRVALVTIHEALSAVPGLLSIERVLETIRITADAMSRYMKHDPRIAVLSLNPHCSEGGMFGHEEREIIEPAVRMATAEGIDATGPFSADTLFHFAVQGAYDAVVCMYHDQGLIPLKLLHFDDGVNITLGLPIIRTSVDHGTAYNLAGTGKASANSMIAAIKMAAEMAVIKQAHRAR